MLPPHTFQFKEFCLRQEKSIMKIGTDGVLLGAWTRTPKEGRILDIGTGTGLIALMLAQRFEAASIFAVEVDDASYEECAENMKNSPWSARLFPIHSSIQDYASSPTLPFDLIVSNPPFFSGGTLSDSNSRNSVRHTTKLPSGELLSAVRTLLAADGIFSVILPYIEGLRFMELAETYQLCCNRITEVRSLENKPIERLLLEFSKKQRPQKKDQLIIQRPGRHNYTEEYVSLTKNFYLFM